MPDAVLLLGTGESSDAYHMSSPHPEGAGARLAMRRAWRLQALAPADIDYINLHGTGTPSNDSAESLAVTALFGTGTPCSSTKAATGHTLGAAGALEAVICALALRHGLVPAGLNRAEPDPQLAVNYLTANRRAPLGAVLSNSFGFGGVNCALLFGRASLSVITLSAGIEGIGLLGPGLPDWPTTAAVLAGTSSLSARAHAAARTGRVAAVRSGAAPAA